MRFSTTAIITSVALLTISASAAPSARGYENGPVWDVRSIQTKDGHFDDYMKFVTTTWKTQQEALKKAGVILDYKVFVAVDPRDNEADITLATEFKDFSKYDVPLDEQEAFAKKMSGSLEAGAKQQAARGSIRTLRGNVLMRELKLQ
jgi:chitodextrinase